MINRLSELQGSAGGITTNAEHSLSHKMSSSTIITIDATHSEFETIETKIEEIDNASKRIDILYNVKRTALPEKQRQARMEVDKIVVQTAPLILVVKNLLESVQQTSGTQKNAKSKATGNVWSDNMLNSAIRKYKHATMQFQQSTQKFRSAVQEDFTRVAKIVHPEITQQQIQVMLDSNDPATYLQTHLMAISPELLDEVHELEQEHERVKKLEATIADIQELFNTCAMLVVQAQDRLDEIEVNVQQTFEAAEKGKKQLQKAEEYTVQTRKTKVKTMILSMVCLAIIVLVILNALGILDWFKFD